ncbi:MAG TPA: twin-arginine translocase TatA/TatE family subunit [Fimbriimonas sp.]|nr:twin-arginine translocase TatA/TatE family subunit [Fimbriimonas sp.]
MLNTLAYFNVEMMALVVVAIVILFGGKKIPELMRGAGQGLGEFKRGLEEGKQQLMQAVNTTDTKPVEEAKPVAEKTTLTNS